MEKRLIDINPIIGDLTAMKSMCDAIALDGMIKALEEAPAVYAADFLREQWISVEDRLPDKEGKYLVTVYDGITLAVLYFYKRYPYCNSGIRTDRPVWCDYDNYGYGDFEEKSVTHWMPLPEPPEVGKA